MRSPDKIKKGLECCGKINGEDCGVKCPYVSQLNCIENKDEDALARILQLEEDKVRSEATITQLSGTIKHLRDEQSRVPRWIPVEERLPEESNMIEDGKGGTCSDLVIVFVRDDNENTFTCDDIIANGEWVNYPAPLFDVTHWMPLPELPKEVPGENGRL